MNEFIQEFNVAGSGLRLAIKDLIDQEGCVTTAGSRALAEHSSPAEKDAACLLGAREGGAIIVGRTNMHELAFGVTGINPWYGTPVNPLGKDLVPGGSSSGSAVAVATGTADVAFGSDTGGSIRIPAACCGVAGLKTTRGRIPLEGVWPLSPILDSLGPMAKDVKGLIDGMTLLEPSFLTRTTTIRRVGKIRLAANPIIERALSDALTRVGWDVIELDVPEWFDVSAHCVTIMKADAWITNRHLLERSPASIGEDVRLRLEGGSEVTEQQRFEAESEQTKWTTRMQSLYEEFDLLVTPTLTIFPPTLREGRALLDARSRCTLPANFAGVPALSLPIPTDGELPASIQLMAPMFGEEALLSAGLELENAVRTG